LAQFWFAHGLGILTWRSHWDLFA